MTQQSQAVERLASLRRRLALLLGVLAGLGLAVLATTATIVDTDLRSDRTLEQQQGLASRAAALVFADDELPGWNVGGVIDDRVAAEADVLVVIDQRTGAEIYRQGPVSDIAELALRGFVDAAEEGVTGTTIVANQSWPAAAAPFFDDNGVAGVVVVASEPGPDRDHQRLVAFVWSTAIALTVASFAGAWFIAGRFLRPMGEAIEREARFLSMAAHDLRTPIARSQAVAESTLLTARALPPSPERTALMTELRRFVALARHTSSDVHDVLLIGRIDADQLEHRTSVMRIDQLVADFETTIPELAVITSGPVELAGDPVLVRHAFANLFSNAQRHGAVDGTPLLIEATVSNDNGVRVVVTDNGRGFGQANLDQIFERHEGSLEGTGLGLWLVRHIVEEGGGTITADHGVPNGAVFRLWWPSLP